MPSLTFVLPHWAYWLGLVAFPLAAMYMTRRQRSRPRRRLSITLAYFLLLTGGFLGVHRLYLKSYWSLAFIALFLALLWVNVESRQVRDDFSAANNAVTLAKLEIRRAEKSLKRGRRNAEQRLAKANDSLGAAQERLRTVETEQTRWNNFARGLGATILMLLILDALLMPRLVRARDGLEKDEQEDVFQCPTVEQEHDDSREPFRFNRWISRLNGFAGEFVAYWSVIAVFVYYYEVIARYVFNSPTNWAHEAMFLMFGMQYLIAGGFCLRESAHVRVDVIYVHIPKRMKAILDVVTSAFFFIFVVTLLVTGWIFFHDAFSIKEVSFTEWGIQYWPIKFALPLGAALLMVQGAAQLLKDITVALRPDAASLDTEVRPEG